MMIPALTRVASAFVLVCSHAAFAVPANDAFESVVGASSTAFDLFVAGSSASASNVDATTTGEPRPPGYSASTYQATLWYKWECPVSDFFEINTNGSGIDTVLAVWSSTAPSSPTIGSLQLVHVNDLASDGGTDSGIRFSALGDTIYYISVASKSSQRGNIMVGVTSALPSLVNRLPTISLSNAAPNITSASATVTVTLGVNSPGQGMSISNDITQGALTVYDPSRAVVTSVSLTNANRTGGNNFNGAYAVSFTIPRYSVPGTYSMSLRFQNTATGKIAGYGWEEQSPYPEGSTSTFTVINTGSLVPPVSSVQFAAATSSVTESSSSASVMVTRTGDLFEATSVQVSTANGSGPSGALAGTDYTAVTAQVLTFAINETSKTVSVPILNRSGNQGERTFTLALHTATGATIGSQSSHEITIADSVEPSVVEFSAANYTTTQEATTMTVTLTRTGGDSAVSVQLSTANGSAIAGTDFSGIANQTVNFPSSVNTVDVALTLLHPTDDHGHRQFSLALSSPSINASVGARASAIVRILATDTVAPVVSGFVAPTPGIGSIINGVLGGSITVAGTASDDKGLASVQVSVDNGITWTSTVPSGSSWVVSVRPPGGLTTIIARAIDSRGNTSAPVTRTFTYKVLVALTVIVNGSGSVTGKLNGAAYEVGKTYTLTAVPGTGQAFDNWAGPGISTPASELAKLSFVVSPALSLSPTITVTFIANPYLASNNVAGSYNGLVKAHTGSAPFTVSSNATNGFINVTTTAATGAFTGSVKLDGATLTTPISGVFDNNGSVKFGAARTSTTSVPRVGKPPLTLAMTLNKAAKQITGSLQESYRARIVAQSDFVADRAAYSTSALLPLASGLLNQSSTKGYYTAAFLARDPTSVTQPASIAGVTLSSRDYPQGEGTCTLTLTNAGIITCAASLADGTAVTATGNLSKDNTAVFYKDLYAGRGSLGGVLTFTRSTVTTLAGTDFFWFRPYLGTQWYPFGWPDGVFTDLVGGEYKLVAGTSALPDLAPASLGGNAQLVFTDGLLGSSISKDLNLSTTNVVSKLGAPADATYGMVLAPTTGLIGGATSTFFTHTDGTKPTFKAVIVQKGIAAPGAYGYFLSTAPKVVNGLGESGAVTLLRK